MMTIDKNTQGAELTVTLVGRLDTVSAPDFETIVKNELAGIETLVLELKDLEYTSSAGLRVILLAQKTMNKQGKMMIRGANQNIMEVFEVTGFINILTIE